MDIPPPSSVAASTSGAPLAQSSGSALTRAAHDAAAQRQRVDAGRRTDRAAGIGGPDAENLAAGDRDGDARQAWELPAPSVGRQRDPATPPCPARSDERGQNIDLCG